MDVNTFFSKMIDFINCLTSAFLPSDGNE